MFQHLKKATQNLWRHWENACAAMLIIGLSLSMFHGLLLIQKKASSSLRAVSQKFSFSVYLRDDTDPFEIGKLITALEELPEVSPPVTFTSKEAAFEFVRKNFSLDPAFLNTYKLSLPASITITPRNLEDTTKIENFLESKWASLLRDPFASKDKQKSLNKDMMSFIRSVQRSTIRTILFFIIFGIIAFILLHAFTLHLAFRSRRAELAVLKFMGAPISRLAAPFIIEAVIIGIGAFLIHGFLLLLIPFDFGSGRELANILILEFAGVFFLSIISGFLTSYFHLRRS